MDKIISRVRCFRLAYEGFWVSMTLYFIFCLFIFTAAFIFIPAFSLRTLVEGKDAQVVDYARLQSKNSSLKQSQLFEFVRSVVKPAYLPDEQYWRRLHYTIGIQADTAVFTTNSWNVGSPTLYVEFDQSIRGNRYRNTGINLIEAVYVKEKISGNSSANELSNGISRYYLIPKDLKITVVKDFQAKIGGTVQEFVWKNDSEGVIESRSVWYIEEENIAYFVACRVHRDSPLFTKNTCYLPVDE